MVYKKYTQKFEGVSQSIEANKEGEYELYLLNNIKNKYSGDISNIIEDLENYNGGIIAKKPFDDSINKYIDENYLEINHSNKELDNHFKNIKNSRGYYANNTDIKKGDFYFIKYLMFTRGIQSHFTSKKEFESILGIKLEKGDYLSHLLSKKGDIFFGESIHINGKLVYFKKFSNEHIDLEKKRKNEKNNLSG